MKASIKVEGLTKLEKKLAAMPRAMTKGVRRAVIENAQAYQGEVIERISRGTRSGVERKLGGNASAPGEAPKTDTGALVSSIQVRTRGSGLIAEVFSNLEYAFMLEFGTSRLAPRPVWIPTFKYMQRQMTRNINKEVKKVLNRR